MSQSALSRHWRNSIQHWLTVAKHRLRAGSFGENKVAKVFRKAGYKIVAQNWRCHRGEIDLVAVKGVSITICEVKTREEKFKHYNAALESVDARKIQTLVDLSYAFLHSISYGKGIKKPALRIAVAEVYYKEFLWIKRCTSISIKYLNNYVF